MVLTPVDTTIKFPALEIMPIAALAFAEFNNGDCIECNGNDADKEETFKSPRLC